MKSYQVARLLAYVTGLINQELLLQVEYLAAENRFSGCMLQLGCGARMNSAPRGRRPQCKPPHKANRHHRRSSPENEDRPGCCEIKVSRSWASREAHHPETQNLIAQILMAKRSC